MNYSFLIAIVLVSFHSISSNIICDSPKNEIKSLTLANGSNDPDDTIDIKFIPLVTHVKEITFTAGLEINANNSVIQELVKTFDFKLIYRVNNEEKSQLCRYNIPTTGNVSRVLPFLDLIFFTDYTIEVGYTLKSNKSFEKKDTFVFTTCFGEPGIRSVRSLNR